MTYTYPLRSKEYKKQRREFVQKAKDKPCADCGISYPYYVMDFDHVRGEKFKSLSGMHRYKIDVLQIEIDKCDVVCANCHRIRTHKRSQP